MLFLQLSVLSFEEFQMVFQRLFRLGQGIDENLAGPLVDFIGEILRRRRRFLKGIELGQGIEDLLQRQLALLAAGF